VKSVPNRTWLTILGIGLSSLFGLSSPSVGRWAEIRALRTGPLSGTGWQNAGASWSRSWGPDPGRGRLDLGVSGAATFARSPRPPCPVHYEGQRARGCCHFAGPRATRQRPTHDGVGWFGGGVVVTVSAGWTPRPRSHRSPAHGRWRRRGRPKALRCRRLAPSPLRVAPAPGDANFTDATHWWYGPRVGSCRWNVVDVLHRLFQRHLVGVVDRSRGPRSGVRDLVRQRLMPANAALTGRQPRERPR
jgi:hypothetical protein